jgi:pimeloyl-ACP methyl ester carboxylesterase
MRPALRCQSFGADVGGMPVVVLPGLGVSRYLRAGCAELARQSGRRVHLVDPPGFGANSGVLEGPVTVAAVAECLGTWLEDQGPVLLVGQSTGCLPATALARRRPSEERGGVDVRAVALVGPVFDPARATVAKAGARLLADGSAEPWWLGPSEAPEWIRNARALPGYLRSCLRERLEECLEEVSCEVLIVRGDRDPLSRHAWVAGLADRPSRTLVTVPGGAHTFMAKSPPAFAEALRVGRFGGSVQVAR